MGRGTTERKAATQEGGRHLLRIARRLRHRCECVGGRVGLGRLSKLVVIDEEVLRGRDQERSVRHETEAEVGRIAEVTQQLRRPLRRGRQVEPLRLHSVGWTRVGARHRGRRGARGALEREGTPHLQHHPEATRLLVLLEREHVRAVALLGRLTALQRVPAEANPVRAVSRLGLCAGRHATGDGLERTRPRSARQG